MKYPIIMLATSRWDAQYSSTSFSLAKEFSKENQVFYIDYPFTIKDFIAGYTTQNIQTRKQALLFGKNIYKNIKGLPDNFTTVTPQLVLPINWLPSGSIYNYFSKINNKIILNTIKKIIKDHNLTNYIYINSFNPFYYRCFPDDHLPDIKVYLSVDDISQSVYVLKHGPRLERQAIEDSDISIATSLELCRQLSTDTNKVSYLPNAADISIFKRTNSIKERPPELQHITDKKIIGYTGNVCHRLDYELLKKIAEKHHDKILLIVGPRNDGGRLSDLPNVMSVGKKDIHELPAYLRYVDCAIIPFKCNKLTASIYPLKINEYLAAGKPVVSTNFSKDIQSFGDVIYIAKNHHQFVENIDQALQDTSEEMRNKRIERSEANTWSARVETFWHYIGSKYKAMEILPASEEI